MIDVLHCFTILSLAIADMNPAGPTSLQEQAAYLQTLPAIRERCADVFDLAQDGKLKYWEYHVEKEIEVIDYCAKIIQVSDIPHAPSPSFVDNLALRQRDFGTNYASARAHSHPTPSHLTVWKISAVNRI